jgi:hypothetical protein
MKAVRAMVSFALVVCFSVLLSGCLRVSFVVPDRNQAGGVWVVRQRGSMSDRVFRCVDVAQPGAQPQPTCVRATQAP